MSWPCKSVYKYGVYFIRETNLRHKGFVRHRQELHFRVKLIPSRKNPERSVILIAATDAYVYCSCVRFGEREFMQMYDISLE